MTRFASLLSVCLPFFLTLSVVRPALAQSTAFFYGPVLPDELLAGYDRVVVEPGHGHVPRPGGAELVAYLSIGEVADGSADRAHVQPAWVLARNDGWKSAVMDLAAPGFRADLLERRFESLWARGYRAFFLDTLDSYQRAAPEGPLRERQRTALVSLVRALKERHPEATLLLNRGFELLDALPGLVGGVVAESLFSAYRADTGRYEPTSKEDQAWLLAQLRAVVARGLKVTVIDYAPPGARCEARALARKIAALGFTPYVTDGALAGVGVSTCELVPRRVLVLAHAPSDALEALAPVLEHLGYVIEPHDLARGLPRPVAGTLAGIVTFRAGEGPLPADYERFVEAQVGAGVRVVMFGAPGIAPESAAGRALGFASSDALMQPGAAGLHIATRDALARFEAEPRATPLDLPALRVTGKDVTEHLAFETARGTRAQALVSTRWGAWASTAFLAPSGLSGERAWSIDPFALFTRALAQEPAPIPDLTTENGRRLAMFIVRAQGLGAPSRLPGRPETSALLEELLSHYPVPHALDLEPSEQNTIVARDREAARTLSHLGARLVRERLPPGRARLGAEQPSIAQLAPLGEPTEAGVRVAMPMAGDYHYIPEGVHEAYPYRAAAETLARTDAPRRLLPAALDYHAASLASDGGRDAILGLYAHIFEAGALPIRVSEHEARVRGFRTQVLLRTLDGAFALRGSALPRTVRLPDALGEVDLAGSRGVAALSGRYLTFLPEGPRVVRFAASPARVPHLRAANAEVREVVVEPERAATSMRFWLVGALDLDFTLAGLVPSARCTLAWAGGRTVRRADAQGSLSLRLAGVRQGRFTLRCDATKERP